MLDVVACLATVIFCVVAGHESKSRSLGRCCWMPMGRDVKRRSAQAAQVAEKLLQLHRCRQPLSFFPTTSACSGMTREGDRGRTCMLEPRGGKVVVTGQDGGSECRRWARDCPD